MGKNVAEKRNSGSWTRATRSKSCHERKNVQAASPAQLKVKLVRMAAGQQSMTHGEAASPSSDIQTMNDAA